VTRAARSVGLVLGAALLAYSAQQLLTPVLPPLSRELELTEIELGLVIALAAATLAVTGPRWGHACDRIGHRAVLTRGLLLALAGLTGFAAVCAAGLHTDLPRGVVLGSMILTRSIVFGAGLAAVPVAALAYMSAVSTSQAERTKLVGLVGAVQGGSMVLGPAAGGALAAAELLLPVYVAPVVLLAVLAVLAVRPLAAAGPAGGAAPAGGPPLRVSDRRVLPFLTAGFLLFLGLGLIQVIMGFLYQDRLDLDAQGTASAVGLAGFLIGLVLVATQAVAVPALRWPSRRLIGVGAAAAICGYLVVAGAGGFWPLTIGMLLIALGLGLAIPGYNAGALHAVPEEFHGRVAGLLTAMTGVTFIAGPLAGTVLYRLDDRAPALVAAVLSAAALVVAARLHAAVATAAETLET
jgi:DHA1 family tetracycline resistance protein-like MFS transporter